MSLVNWQKVTAHRKTMVALLAASALGVGYAMFQVAGRVQQMEISPMQYVSMQNFDYEGAYDVAVALLFLVIPAGLSWYARNYAKTAESQKRMNAIASMAGQAVAYAEDCEHRGERELTYNLLDVPESLARNPTPGHQKMVLAAAWLVDELARQGIKRIGIEDAAKWVSAEYQKTVGDMRMAHSVSALTDMAADLLGQLGRAGHITLPNNTLETVALIQTVADWVASQPSDATLDRSLQRDAAMARIAPRSLMMAGANGRNSNGHRISPEVRLTLLAKQSVDFVTELEKQGKLRMAAQDTAKAWMIQQVQQDDIPATAEQIDQAISAAFEKQG